MGSTANQEVKEKKGLKAFFIKLIKNNAGFIIVIALILFINWRFDIYYIQTGSMEPTLEVGSIVVSDPKAEPEKGDMVAYSQRNMVIVHRVIEITEDGYITKGDSNNIADGEIENDRILGTVILECDLFAPLVRKITGLA